MENDIRLIESAVSTLRSVELSGMSPLEADTLYNSVRILNAVLESLRSKSN